MFNAYMGGMSFGVKWKAYVHGGSNAPSNACLLRAGRGGECAGRCGVSPAPQLLSQPTHCPHLPSCPLRGPSHSCVLLSLLPLCIDCLPGQRSGRAVGTQAVQCSAGRPARQQARCIFRAGLQLAPC